MKEVTVVFNGFEFPIVETDKGFNINDLRLKVIDFTENNPELLIGSLAFKSTQSLTPWSRYLSEGAKKFYEYETVRGGNNRGATYVNEKGVYKYSEWLNEEFGFAVIEAFTLLVNGKVEEAQKVASKVARSYFREDGVEYTKELSSDVGYFAHRSVGNLQKLMASIHNTINLAITGFSTEELREKARQVSGSKAKKISHRELYDDATTIRYTLITTSLLQRIEQIEDNGLSPKEFLNDLFDHVYKVIELHGGAKAPVYKSV